MVDVWYLFWVGLIFGLIADRMWMSSGDLDKDIESAGKWLKWLTWFEHYHWAIVFVILYGRFNSLTIFGFTFPLIVALGLATALLLGEHFQNHPYGYGSDHFIQSTVIGAFLIIILIYCFILISGK